VEESVYIAGGGDTPAGKVGIYIAGGDTPAKMKLFFSL